MRVSRISVLLSAALLCTAAPPPRAPASDERDLKHDRSWAAASGPARNIRFEALTRADGISSDRLYQVLQDRRGFVWFTTTTGLIRHDGYESVRYPGLPLVGSTFTTNRLPGALFEARDGTLWVATDVLTRFDPNLGRFTTVLNPRSGPSRPGVDRITAICDGPEGSLWVGLSSYDKSGEISEPVLYLVSTASGRTVPHQIDPGITDGKPVSFRAIEQDKRGRLWLATSVGLLGFDPRTNSFRHCSHAHNGKYGAPVPFNGLVWDNAGHLWVRTPTGIERFNPDTEVFDRFIATKLWNMSADPDGRLWLWGGSAGLQVFDPSSPAETALQTVSYSPPGSPFEERAIPMLGSDRQGNIYAYLFPSYALHRYSPRTAKFGKYAAEPDDPSSLRGTEVRGFAESKNGSIWIATHDGLSLFDPPTKRFTNFGYDSRNPKGLPTNHITSVFNDRSNTLWVATDMEFLGQFDDKHARYSGLRLSHWSEWAIQSMFEDSRGRFWVGDQMGAVRLVDRQTGAVSLQVDGHVAYEDREGNVWFGAPPGLHKLDPTGRLRSIRLLEPDVTNPLALPIVRSIYEDPAGLLWLATNSGLFQFDPRSEKATRFTSHDGLASDILACLLPDDDGNLWISSDHGISRFNSRDKRFYNYDERDGLQGTLFGPRACYRARDGRLYFGGNLGFNAFYPRDVLSLPHDTPVIVTSFKVKDQDRPLAGMDAVRLNYWENGLSFQFAVPSAASPWNMRFRFRLEGMEDRWIEVDSAHRLARYTDVPPGDYVFRAEASTDGRSWGTMGAAMRVTIAPPWWRTWWADTIVALLGVALLAAAYRLRVSALHRRERRLTAVVHQRTAELESARDQADSANRAKSEFLANMSHELRTPLNAILGFSNLLREGGVSGEQREQVDIINRSGEHLLTLIDDVLDVAKIEAGKHALVIAPCDLRSLVYDVIEMLGARARTKNLELLWVQPPDFARYVRADASKLRQVLINLLGNAVKFTEEGTVTLRLSATDAGQGNLLLRFEVEDTGIGMSPEDQARIFDPFVQLGQTATQKGTGLGLTITRRFVEMMGGTLNLESAPGRGSRFIVEIPVEPALECELSDARVGHEHRYVLEPGQPECRVLIVEDNPENATVLQQMLRNAGFQVRVARNGVVGVEQFQQWDPHFIWMDVRMPEMDGMEATRRIREMDGGREVRIAAVTASAFVSERDLVMAAGMDDVIGKPYRPKEVFDCMARHLGVQYRVDNPVVAQPTEAAGLVRSAALAALPPQLRRDLKDAVVSLDHQCICLAIDRVREVDGDLASALTRLGEGFAYTAILDAIERAERKSDVDERTGMRIE